MGIIVVVAVPILVSTDWVRDQVTDAVRKKTGRNLVIVGEVSFSVFPNILLSVVDARLSNPLGQDGNFVIMSELDISLKLLPLLNGQVEVDQLIMIKPVISLEVDKNGSSNWSLNHHTELSRMRDGGAASSKLRSERVSQSESLPAIGLIQFGDMQLIDGTFSYRDLRAGTSQELSTIYATISLSSFNESLDIDGSAIWEGEELDFHLALSDPRALATGASSSILLEMDSPHLNVAFSGAVAAREEIDIKGELELASSSLKGLIQWLNFTPPEVSGLGVFSLTSAVFYGKDEIELSSVKLKFDGINAEGGLLVSFADKRPLIQATLAADKIDFNQYFGGANGTGATFPGEGAGVLGMSASPLVAASGWNATETIDVSGLREIDADIRFSARELRLQKLHAGQSALAITLREGILTLDLSELQLYEGQAVGKLTIDGTGEMPVIAASMNVNNVAARMLLNDTAGLSWLEGRGKISGSLASSGRTEYNLVEALNGEINIRFTDGIIHGFNLANLMQNLKKGAALDWSYEEGGDSDFSEFSADFTVANGVAKTSNLQMLGPLVRLNGVGISNLPARTVDFRILPKIVGPTEGPEEGMNLGGLEIPFMISGLWDHPIFTPDLALILQNPDQAVEIIEQIRKSFKNLGKGNGNMKNTIEGIAQVHKPKEFLNLLGSSGGNALESAPPASGDVLEQSQLPALISEELFNQLLDQ